MNRAVASGQKILVFAQGARLLLFVLVTSYLGRSLEPDDFALFALVSVLFVVALDFLDMGSGAVATRQIAHSPDSERAVLGTLLAWRRIVALGLALICLLLANSALVEAGSERYVLMIAAGTLFVLHLSAYHVVFQVRQAFGMSVLLGLVAQISFLAASIAVVRLQVTGSLVAMLVAVREIIQVVGSRFIATRLLGYSLTPPLLPRGLRDLLRQAWIFGLCALLYRLSFHSGTFVVWALAGAESLAVYGASTRLFTPVIDSAWAFVTPLIASMSLLVRRDEDAFRRQLTSHFHLMLGVAALFSVCAVLLAPVLLESFYGDRYLVGPLSSLDVFRVLGFAYGMSMITPLLVVAFLALKRERELLALSAMGLVLNLALNLWGVPRFGVHGAAVASLITETFVLGALAIRLITLGELRPNIRPVLFSLLPGALMAIALLLLSSNQMVALTIAVIGAPICIVMLWQLPEQRASRADVPTDSGEVRPGLH